MGKDAIGAQSGGPIVVINDVNAAHRNGRERMQQHPKDCQYCTKDQRLSEIMIEICPLQVSTLYLFREQTYRGRCIVALNAHQPELFSLDDGTLHQFSKDVARAAHAVQKAFKPGKINYAVYGDLVPHLHYHIVPKYKDGDCWGKPFEMNPSGKSILSDEEYGRIIRAIKNHLAA
jgi:diadenosine tetraphosphate (Ap4A) HIT family hydrolase